MHATCFGAEGRTPGVGGEREGAGCECAKVAVVSASAPRKKKNQMHSNMEMLQLEVVWGVWVQNLCVRESVHNNDFVIEKVSLLTSYFFLSFSIL